MSASIGTELRLSRLMLGTVQFGMPYGVANGTGQPAYADVLEILEAALEGGVNCFDTAAAYGTSEEVLGRAIAELKVAEQVVVVTKVRPLTTTECSDRALAAQAIEASVAESRRRLQLDCLPVVLFHREIDAQHAEILLRLQAKGWLRQAGVSCDNEPGPAQRFAAECACSALQVPANVLDRRHEHSGLFAQAAARGVSLFVRSVFLQGLLLMPEELIPPPLRQVVPARQVLGAMAADGGMSLAELAVRYLLAQTGVTCILAGVETVAQVRENVLLVARGPLPADLLKAVNAAVPKLPASLLTPSQWPALAEAAAPSSADHVSEDAAHDQK